MARHFSRQHGLLALHFRFNEGMTGLPHDRAAALLRDVIIEALRRLDLGNNCAARYRPQDVPGVDHHQTITPQDVALLVNGADPISVSVVADPDIRLVLLDRKSTRLNSSHSQ